MQAERDTAIAANEETRKELNQVKQELIEAKILITKYKTQTTKLKHEMRDSSQFSSTSRHSKSIPNPPLFTDGEDPTWEDWSSKIEQKLTVNQDHYPTSESKIAFVIGRLGGLAVSHTTSRRQRKSLNPYTSYEEILDQLAEVFEDTNKLGMAKIHYDKLVMREDMTFRAFFAEFMRLGEVLAKRDDALLDDLVDKLPDHLQLALRRRGLGPRASLREVKAYLITQDDGDRAAYHEQMALQESPEEPWQEDEVPAENEKWNVRTCGKHGRILAIIWIAKSG